MQLSSKLTTFHRDLSASCWKFLEILVGRSRTWRHWLPERFEPFIPLHEFVSEQYQKVTQPWVQEVFKPLPPDEVEAVREYMD